MRHVFEFCCQFVFFFKYKTAYDMRISDWSSDVCSSDLQMMWQQILDGYEQPFGDRIQIGWPPAALDCGLLYGFCLFGFFRGRIRMIDRRSVVKGKSVSGRLELGGRRIIQKKIEQ